MPGRGPRRCGWRATAGSPPPSGPPPGPGAPGTAGRRLPGGLEGREPFQDRFQEAPELCVVPRGTEPPARGFELQRHGARTLVVGESGSRRTGHLDGVDQLEAELDTTPLARQGPDAADLTRREAPGADALDLLSTQPVPGEGAGAVGVDLRLEDDPGPLPAPRQDGGGGEEGGGDQERRCRTAEREPNGHPSHPPGKRPRDTPEGAPGRGVPRPAGRRRRRPSPLGDRPGP